MFNLLEIYQRVFYYVINGAKNVCHTGRYIVKRWCSRETNGAFSGAPGSEAAAPLGGINHARLLFFFSPGSVVEPNPLWTKKSIKKKNSARRSEMCAIMIKSRGHYSSACKALRGYHTAEINSTTARPVPPLLPPLSAQPLFTQAVQSRAVAPRLDLAVLDEVTKDGWWRGRLAVVVPPNQWQN